MVDIIVVGGGPAGMTAALYARRNGRSVLVIEKTGFGGQITHSPKVENYPGTMQMSGSEFADRLMDQILTQGAQIEYETVCGVSSDTDGFSVTTKEGGCYRSRSVILATGVKHRMLGLPGEADLIGEGISFCAVCDGDFYEGRDVCVAGGGNSALQEALLLADKCRSVTILQDLPQCTGEQRLLELLRGRNNVKIRTGLRITQLEQSGGELKAVLAEDVQSGQSNRFPCDGLFVAIGLYPDNKAYAPLAQLDTHGYFASGEDCQTRTPGVFCAGDCRAKDVRQLATAIADGAVAALAACRFVQEYL